LLAVSAYIVILCYNAQHGAIVCYIDYTVVSGKDGLFTISGLLAFAVTVRLLLLAAALAAACGCLFRLCWWL
jgi:hypothetical protein